MEINVYLRSLLELSAIENMLALLEERKVIYIYRFGSKKEKEHVVRSCVVECMCVCGREYLILQYFY